MEMGGGEVDDGGALKDARAARMTPHRCLFGRSLRLRSFVPFHHPPHFHPLRFPRIRSTRFVSHSIPILIPGF